MAKNKATFEGEVNTVAKQHRGNMMEDAYVASEAALKVPTAGPDEPGIALSSDDQGVTPPYPSAPASPEGIAAKKARKKPDRSNPPYYEVYSENPDFSERKLELSTATAGRALKFMYLAGVECAKQNRVMFAVRCKTLTMADLMKE